MQVKSQTFDIEFVKIGLYNVRIEFSRYYELIQEPIFQKKFVGPIEPIKTPYMIWGGMPGGLLTLICQRVIVGIESYITGAAWVELGVRGLLNEETLEIIRNPFRLEGKGVVEKYYHTLPSLVDDAFSLKHCDNELWRSTKDFYGEVRNRLFNGFEIYSPNQWPVGIVKIFEQIRDMHLWIDSWHNLDKHLSGQ